MANCCGPVTAAEVGTKIGRRVYTGEKRPARRTAVSVRAITRYIVYIIYADLKFTIPGNFQSAFPHGWLFHRDSVSRLRNVTRNDHVPISGLPRPTRPPRVNYTAPARNFRERFIRAVFNYIIARCVKSEKSRHIAIVDHRALELS